MTLGAAVLFCATGVRMRLVLAPLLLLLILINIGYSIGAIPFYDKPEIVNWIATSWYMAVTVMFFAMVMSEDTLARLDMLRRGLIVGAMIASCRPSRAISILFPADTICSRSTDAGGARSRIRTCSARS